MKYIPERGRDRVRVRERERENKRGAETCHHIHTVPLVWEQLFDVPNDQIDAMLFDSDEWLEQRQSVLGLVKMKQTAGGQMNC
jgi:hypothetical protein